MTLFAAQETTRTATRPEGIVAEILLEDVTKGMWLYPVAWELDGEPEPWAYVEARPWKSAATGMVHVVVRMALQVACYNGLLGDKVRVILPNCEYANA